MSFARNTLLLIATLSLTPSLGCGDTLDDLTPGEGATFTGVYDAIGEDCAGCHAPGAPGRTEGIEATQNWSSRSAALSSLRGDASGLIGNFAACNGEPLLRSTAEQSLLVASLDSDVRANFESPDNPDCNGDAISDQTLRVDVPGSAVQELMDWVDSGRLDN